jgi:hypothetical protein
MISDEARAKYNKSFDEAKKLDVTKVSRFGLPISIFSVIQDGEEVRKPMVKTLI